LRDLKVCCWTSAFWYLNYKWSDYAMHKIIFKCRVMLKSVPWIAFTNSAWPWTSSSKLSLHHFKFY
jgi:hypothetical protein